MTSGNISAAERWAIQKLAQLRKVAQLYCANDPCETEATHCIDHDDGPDITPLCSTCAAAYEMGQASPNANVRPLDEEGW